MTDSQPPSPPSPALPTMRIIRFADLRPVPDESNPHLTWRTLYHNIGSDSHPPAICPICQDITSPEDHIIRHKPCATEFHRACLHGWFRQQQQNNQRPTCPNCRGTMHMTQIARIRRMEILRDVRAGALAAAEATIKDVVHQYFRLVEGVVNATFEDLAYDTDPFLTESQDLIRRTNEGYNVLAQSMTVATETYAEIVADYRRQRGQRHRWTFRQLFELDSHDDDHEDGGAPL